MQKTIVNFFLFAFLYSCLCNYAEAMDKYFRSAIEKMIIDSKVPIDGYGFDLKYEHVRLTRDIHENMNYTLFTKDNNSYLKEVEVRHNDNNDDEYRLERLTIYRGAYNATRATKKTIKNDPPPSFTLETDLRENCSIIHYNAYLTIKIREQVYQISLYEQAYQLLVNPCFYYLEQGFSPENILQLPDHCVVKQQSEEGCEVYLLKDFIDHPLKPEYLLYFSPSNNDKLVKCIFRDLESSSKTIYVTKWKKVGKTLVASQIYRCYGDGNANGNIDTKEIITITSPKIGGIKDDLFDTTKIPEFNRKWWNTTMEHHKAELGDPNWLTHHKPPVELPVRTGHRWIIIVNVFLVALLLYPFIKKYIRSKK